MSGCLAKVEFEQNQSEFKIKQNGHLNTGKRSMHKSQNSDKKNLSGMKLKFYVAYVDMGKHF